MIRERITSRSNPLVSRVKRLRDQRAARREEGMLLGEGPKLLQEALRWDAGYRDLCAGCGASSSAASDAGGRGSSGFAGDHG